MVKKIYSQYREIIMYVVMGVGTTIVSLASYYLFTKVFLINFQVSNILSWILAVLFAYVTNKKYVFESNVSDFYGVFKEMLNFFCARLSTLIIEMMSMFIFVTIFALNPDIIKLFNQVIVLVLNYIFSKLIVFKKGKVKSNEKDY